MSLASCLSTCYATSPKCVTGFLKLK